MLKLINAYSEAMDKLIYFFFFDLFCAILIDYLSWNSLTTWNELQLAVVHFSSKAWLDYSDLLELFLVRLISLTKSNIFPLGGLVKFCYHYIIFLPHKNNLLITTQYLGLDTGIEKGH